MDMRMADCGASTLPGWQLGWAQVIGSHHARFSEDSLAHGSLLLMRGDTQSNYRHALPRTARAVADRINLTFRQIRTGPRVG